MYARVVRGGELIAYEGVEFGGEEEVKGVAGGLCGDGAERVFLGRDVEGVDVGRENAVGEVDFWVGRDGAVEVEHFGQWVFGLLWVVYWGKWRVVRFDEAWS